jgi:enterochelin esterase family protein
LNVGEPLIASPRIDRLRRDVSIGARDAELAFWERLEREGTPLVEEIDGGEHVLITFVWRGGSDTAAVTVVGGVSGYRFPFLEHLEGTSLWYASFPAPRGIRTTYRFLENPSFADRDLRSLNTEELLAPEREPWCADPLNPRSFEAPMMPAVSVIELEGASPQPWVGARDGPHGRIEPHRFESASLENARVVWTYLPFGYDASNEHYPLLLLFDGYGYLQMPVQELLDNLIAEGAMQPIVCAMVHQLDRMEELACAAAFTDAMADELVREWLPSRYRTGGPAVAGGASLGGLAAAYAALRRPDVFTSVISQSGSYWWGPGATLPARLDDASVHWEWLIDEYARSDATPVRWHMDVGALEVAAPEREQTDPDMVRSNRRLRDVLQRRGHEVAYTEFAGGHDWICWRGTLADALQRMFPP